MSVNSNLKILSDIRRAIQSGNLNIAEIACKKILNTNPSNPEAIHLLGVIALQTKNFNDAIKLFKRAISISPKFAESYMSLGIALSKIGQNEESLKALKLASSIQPAAGEIQYHLGLAEMKMENSSAALKHLKKAVRKMPKSKTAFTAIGVVYMQLKQLEEGVKSFKKAISLDSKDSKGYINLGLALQELGKSSEAINAFNQAYKLSPNDPIVKIQLATSLAEAHRTNEALPIFEDTIKKNPELISAQNNYALALKTDLQFSASVEILKNIYSNNQNDPRTASNLAETLMLLGQPDEAIEILKKLENSQDNALILNQIGNIYGRIGKFDLAIETFENAISKDPKNIWAYSSLVAIKDYSFSNKYKNNLLNLIKTETINDQQIISGLFALGNLYDRDKDYEKAFHYFSKANLIRKKLKPFNIKEHNNFIQQLISVFSEELIEKSRKDSIKSSYPVFIVGLPRSGTTLIEKILSSHPKVKGLGEIQDLYIARKNLSNGLTHNRYPSGVEGINKTLKNQFAEWIIARRRSLAPNFERIIDKTPEHFFEIGIASLLFGSPKIIYSNRNLIDTCFSIYTLSIAGNKAYASDLRSLGEYALSTVRLMEHWKTITEIHSVTYESIVNNQEKVSKKMIEYIDLEWDSRVLKFYEEKDPVASASRWQVRQPIYKSSIGRWKNYSDFLRPLIDSLEEHGEVK